MEIDTIRINHDHGIHLRVAAEITRICRRHESDILFSCRDCPDADGCSILSLLMLGATKGTALTVKADGKDAKEAVQEIREFLLNVENGRMQ
jgi:phosphotransferase system HPr (HPr) family protein